MDTVEIWGIDAPVQKIRKNIWAIGEDYILKAGDSDQLKRHIEILNILYRTGIPVAKPIPTTTGEPLWRTKETAYLLTTCLKGTHVTDVCSMDGLAKAHAMGRATARLHRAFQEIQSQLELEDDPFIEELRGWIPNVLEKDHWRLISREEYISAVQSLEKFDLHLPKQLIHRDLHFGNVLFDGEAFTGYIDFDLSRFGIRLFDLCYFLLGLLSNKALQTETLQPWLHVVKQFLAGYQEIQPLQQIECKAAMPMMTCIELLFAAYYMSQDMPEEAAEVMELYRFVLRHEEKIRTCFI